MIRSAQNCSNEVSGLLPFGGYISSLWDGAGDATRVQNWWPVRAVAVKSICLSLHNSLTSTPTDIDLAYWLSSLSYRWRSLFHIIPTWRSWKIGSLGVLVHGSWIVCEHGLLVFCFKRLKYSAIQTDTSKRAVWGHYVRFTVYVLSEWSKMYTNSTD